MSSILRMLALPVCALGFQDTDSRPASRPETRAEAPASFPWAAEARAAIQRIRESKTESMSLRLWEANAWIRPILAKPPMEDVMAFLKAESCGITGCDKPFLWSGAYTMQRRAFVFGDRLAFDWVFVILYRDDWNRATRTTNHGYLGTSAILVAECDEPAEEALANVKCSKGSVLDLVLASPSAKTLFKRWPMLNLITICYDIPSMDHREADAYTVDARLSYSVDVRVCCNLSAMEYVATKVQSYCMLSGLGAPSHDALQNTATLARRDTLGEVRERSISEYWYGGEEAVAANKKKYGFEDPETKQK